MVYEIIGNDVISCKLSNIDNKMIDLKYAVVMRRDVF